MAKGKNTVGLDVNVKGKGVKKTQVEMKQLGKDTARTSKSTNELNRNWKGASRQSSGASKNFSKLSQGMGGIVGAYATLAANIFAIGAAFRFLQSAGDLEKLKEGQELYAASTGVALRSLTSDIIAATDAQVTFANASQAAAIGVAAGLTNDQLVALGKGAKDVSIILGRDVTDSFNRLVRGVTKAEPELLDELGIILRLADASEKYGTMIGKNANDLTQFEKSQAVTVEVMSQLESKYGRIMAVVEPSGNVFTQLGVAFDDIVNQIKEIAMFIAGPIASVLVKAPALALGVMAAFANSLIKSSMAAWAERASVKADELAASYKRAENRLKALQRLRRMKLKGQGGWASTAEAKKQDKALGGITSKGSVAGPALDKLRAGEKMSKAEIRAARMVVQRKKGLDKEMKDNYIRALKEMELKTKTTSEQIKVHFTLATSKLAVLSKQAQLAWQGAMSAIQRAAAATATFMTKVMSAVSWISLAVTLGMVVYQFFRTEEAVDEVAEELDAATSKVTALNDEFKHFNEIQSIIIEDGQGFLQYFEALGNRISSLSVNMQKALFDSFLPDAEYMLSKVGIDQFVTDMREALGSGGVIGQSVEDTLASGIASLNRSKEDLAKVLKEEQFMHTASGMEGVQGYVPEVVKSGDELGLFAEHVKNLESDIVRQTRTYQDWQDQMEALGLTTEGTTINLVKLMQAAQDNEGANALGAFYADMVEGAEEAFEIFGSAKNPVTDFMDVIRDNLTNFELQMIDDNGVQRLETMAEAFDRIQENLFGAKSAADEWKQSLTNATRMARDNAQEVDKLLLGVQGRSTEGRMEDTLKNEMMERLKSSFPERSEEFTEMGRDEALAWAIGFGETQKSIGGSFTPEGLVGQQGTDYRLRNEQLIRQIALFDSLDRKKRESEQRSLTLAIETQKLTAGTTKLVGKRLKILQDIKKNDLKLLDIKNEELEIWGLIEEAREDLGDDWMGEEQQQDRLAILELQTLQYQAQTEELEKQANWQEQSARAANQALESGLQREISAVLKFDEQNLGEAAKKIGKGIVDAMADSLAKTVTEWIMRKNPLTAFQTGAEIVHDRIVAAFKSVGFGGAGETQFMPKGQTPFLPEAEDETSGNIITNSSAWQALFGKKVQGAVYTGEGEAGDKGGFSGDTTVTRESRREGGVFGPLLNSFETLFAKDNTPFLDKLGEFFGGESSFLKGLGSIFTSILGSTADGGSGILGLFSTMFGGPAAAAVDGKALGGIFKGGFRKYAAGGIATRPTLGLIGEGRHNEAVVPLPNGKAIPVDMGSSAQNNNVTVNVSANGNVQTTGQDNEGLGRAIAAAVQEELQNQKRSGGILNRYGTA